MRTYLGLMVLVLCAGWPALGQTQEKKAPASRPAAARDDLSGQVRRITAELRLSDDQIAKFETLLKKARKPKKPADFERALEDAFRARKANNSEAFDKATNRLRVLMAPVSASVLGDIEPELTDKQKSRLQKVIQRLSPTNRLSPHVVAESLALLRADLKLKPEQQKAFDAIANETIKSMNPTPRTRDLSPGELADVLAELQEAVATGDEERIRAVRSKIIDKPENPYDALMRAILDVYGLLSRGQHKPLIKYAMSVHTMATNASGPHEPVQLARLARRLELSQGQAQQVKSIEKTARSYDRSQPIGKALTAYQVLTQVIDLLKPEQLQKYRESLAQPGSGTPNLGRGTRAKAKFKSAKERTPSKAAKPADGATQKKDATGKP